MRDAEITDALRCALAMKYADRARYAYLEEVANGTGMAVRGWADAVVLELWPSDGLRLLGFELKASRGDWKRELKDLRKAENIARFCDGWIVVAPPKVVQLDELPAGWGLWEYHLEKETLRTVRAYAPRVQPKYIPRQFFAALLRRAQVTLPSAEYVGKAVRAAMEAHMRSQNRGADAIKRTMQMHADNEKRRADNAEAVLRSLGYTKRPYGGQWIAPAEPAHAP